MGSWALYIRGARAGVSNGRTSGIREPDSGKKAARHAPGVDGPRLPDQQAISVDSGSFVYHEFTFSLSKNAPVGP